MFPGNRTHNLCAANTMLYHWATGSPEMMWYQCLIFWSNKEPNSNELVHVCLKCSSWWVLFLYLTNCWYSCGTSHDSCKHTHTSLCHTGSSGWETRPPGVRLSSPAELHVNPLWWWSESGRSQTQSPVWTTNTERNTQASIKITGYRLNKMH